MPPPPHATEIDWLPFLSRPRLPSPSAESLAALRHASILITGAGGSIGSALALRLASLGVNRLTLLEASEQALYRLTTALGSESVYPVLGSIDDTTLLEEIFALHRPTILFHAAAYKHVALLEDQSLAAIVNNTLGTQTLVNLAHRHSIQKLILLSTDKAVTPASILGATKRVAEYITLAHGGTVVRLCNVLGTEGSVVDTFLKQIVAGQPLSITHLEAERYFITKEEAVDLLLSSAVAQLQGSVLIPAVVTPHRITALAEFLAASHAPHTVISYRETGLRPGDKLREALVSSEETTLPTSPSGCLQYLTPMPDPAQRMHSLDLLQLAVQHRDLSQALGILQSLVPSYTPSQHVLQLAQPSAHGALQP